MQGKNNLTHMDKQDEKLIEEKFKGVYQLFEEKFDKITESLKEIHDETKHTNSRVNKHDIHIELAKKESEESIRTLKKINTSLNTMMRRVESCEEQKVKDDIAHVQIKKKLDNIDGKIENAKPLKPLIGAMKKPIITGGIVLAILSFVSAAIVEIGWAKVIINIFGIKL
jgi:DNA repair exonuclease SbcCD ATPase subunit